jgi:hypothetical protein
MIRLAVLSDLHVEKGPWHPPAFHADLVVLAGDIGWGPEGVRWIAEHLGGRTAVYVAGNREHWHHCPGCDPLLALRAAATTVPNLHFLSDDRADFSFGGRMLRVLGATLWTDYALEGDRAGAMALAEASMPDYRNGRGADGARLTAAQVAAWNAASVEFLTRELTSPFAGTTLVVTHHAPAAASLRKRRPEHVPTTASITRLEELIEATGPALWVHGHTHWNCDYRLGATRVVTNQRGEPENDGFAPLIVEL